MQCTSCKYPHTEVVDTRHSLNNDGITRRRSCLRCGMRFTTFEQQKDSRVGRPKKEEKHL
jgi:transcriptional repressor NrdR